MNWSHHAPTWWPPNSRNSCVRTKAKLASESEKLQFALGEIDILNKQIQREKATFENV